MFPGHGFLKYKKHGFDPVWPTKAEPFTARARLAFLRLEITGKKRNFGAHIRQHTGSLSRKRTLTKNSGFCAVDCGHNSVNLAAKTNAGRASKLDIAGLSYANTDDICFRNINFHLQ